MFVGKNILLRHLNNLLFWEDTEGIPDILASMNIINDILEQRMIPDRKIGPFSNTELYDIEYSLR